MGITSNCAKFLFYSKSLGADFNTTLMLGRQQLFTTKSDVIEHAMRFKVSIDKTFDLEKNNGYAEPLFELLGASTVDSIDISDYEKSTLIHDMNLPLPEKLRGKYSLLFDGGTLEHVFNFPVAIKNCMDALKPGGYFISITPTNNLCGHGFYQFSPELFFSIFDKQNGFETKQILLAIETPGIGIKDWYKVANPKTVKKRVTLQNENQTYLLVLAKKLEDPGQKSLAVQQSDYENIWNIHSSVHSDTPIETENKIWYFYRKYIPRFVRDFIHKIIGLASKKEGKVSGIGIVNSTFFEKIDL